MYQPKKYWSKEYTIVLVANLIYILIFYIITNYFTV